MPHKSKFYFIISYMGGGGKTASAVIIGLSYIKMNLRGIINKVGHDLGKGQRGMLAKMLTMAEMW